MTRIAIAGAAGRMGRNLVIASNASTGVTLTSAIDRSDNPLSGNDAGLLAGIEAQGVFISGSLNAD